MNEILKLAGQRGAENLLVDFIDSGKNIIAREFLTTYGFNFIEEGHSVLKSLTEKANYFLEGKLYRMPVVDTAIPNLDIFNGANDELT